MAWQPARSAVMAVALAALAGCTSGPGGSLFFPAPGNRVTDSARYVRDVSAAPAGMPRELELHPAPPYIVQPGDVLLVQPASLSSSLRLPGDQPILPDGTIRLGQYGPLEVAGRTLDIIEADVKALLARQGQTDPVIVRLVARESKVYYVLGEVNAPGAFQLKGRETVLDAIVAAGGLNSNASRKNILLSRPTAPDSCRVVLPVEYNDIVQLGDTTTNYQIRAGDRVYVPSKTFCEDLLAFFKHDKEKCGPMPVPCFPAGVTVGESVSTCPGR
jgi:protein involved in polysaccharide export with SLBB domain